ncbi:MAG: hypothetical protein OFPI_27900 [Osedax symbiont Rs2]|nr:MAG: hypothetical protein OFPI_27900 [Osedax symbiont Rs2]
MKKALICIAAIIILIFSAFMWLGHSSSSGRALGLAEGKLQPCPTNPNCVYSDTNSDTDGEHYIAALDISNYSASDSMLSISQIIFELKGQISSENDSYISATFTSAVFRFVDDFEVRLDSQQQLIHFRSASRIGKSDLGVNRKRVAAIKQIFLQRQSN